MVIAFDSTVMHACRESSRSQKYGSVRRSTKFSANLAVSTRGLEAVKGAA